MLLIFAPGKTPFEAAGTLALFTASQFVVCWRLSWLCDCWELDINWPLLLARGAVICWAFGTDLNHSRYTTPVADGVHLLTGMMGGFEDFCDRLVEPQTFLEYLHLVIGQCWSS